MFRVKCELALLTGWLFSRVILYDIKNATNLARLVPMAFVRWVRRTLRERRINMSNYEIHAN